MMPFPTMRHAVSRLSIPWATLLYLLLHILAFLPSESDRAAMLEDGWGWLAVLQTVYDKRAAPDALQRFAWLLLSPLFLAVEWLGTSRLLFTCNVLCALLTLDRRQEYSPGRDSVFDPFVDASCSADRLEWRCGYRPEEPQWRCSAREIAAFKWCCGSNTYVPVIGMLGAVLASRVAGRALPPGWGRAVLHAALSLGWLCVSVGLMYSLGDAHTTHETPWRDVGGWRPCALSFLSPAAHSAWIFQGWLVASLLLWQAGTRPSGRTWPVASRPAQNAGAEPLLASGGPAAAEQSPGS